MNFRKFPIADNFRFAAGAKSPYTIGDKKYRYKTSRVGEGVWKLTVENRYFEPSALLLPALEDVFEQVAVKDAFLTVGENASLAFTFRDRELLTTAGDQAFGVNGTKWMFRFTLPEAAPVFGMGEKNLGLNTAGNRTYFCNTDLFADFSRGEVDDSTADPLYASFPYVLFPSENGWLGILAHCPYPVFMDTGAPVSIEGFSETPGDSVLTIGADGGQPLLYFIPGATAAEVTAKLQRLVGTTPLPPLWALGHHQSRWGYRNFADLAEVAGEMASKDIPNDGTWLDIDYMDGYRVFTKDPGLFADGGEAEAALRAGDQKVVAILDPGIKKDPGYAVYDEALKGDVLCPNPNGDPYTGYVWPGATVFPDFSTKAGRDFWAARVSAFAGEGFDGFWIDMNDPSTGSSDPEDMLFRSDGPAGEADGKTGAKSAAKAADVPAKPLRHGAFRNQYGLGMHLATFNGLKAARPDRRPFVVSRSGFPGSSRFGALWNGDNVSNWAHLRSGVVMTLSMGLSGMPMTGPDVPGFAGDADGELALAWYKTCFLFPLLRNHSAKWAKRQEPYTFGAKITPILSHYIRQRYKFLPYLYNLFLQAEEKGTPIIRPLFHEFPWDPAYAGIADQFMVGPSIMQAPITEEGRPGRTVFLPPGWWFDVQSDAWIAGGRELSVKPTRNGTPIYVRDGSVVPLQAGIPKTNAVKLEEPDIHLFFSRDGGATAWYRYFVDAGDGYGYREGESSELTVSVSRQGEDLAVDVSSFRVDFRPLRCRFILHGPFERLMVTTTTGSRVMECERIQVNLAGAVVKAMATPVITFES